MDKLTEVTKNNPCIHCGKPDWCYILPGGDATVCNRLDDPAPGWQKNGKTDKNGRPVFTRIKENVRKPKPKVINTKHWVYTDREGEPLIKVVRHDLDDDTKKICQYHWNGKRWVIGRRTLKRENIPIYRYTDICEAIHNGETIFLVEGEKCADALWALDIPATTNIGGSQQWSDSDTQDLAGANLVLCPDRDKPGMKLMSQVFKAFPDAQWLYAYQSESFWNNLPDSDGVDIADWIADFKLSAEDIYDAIEPVREHLLTVEVPDLAPQAESIYTERAVKALYSDGHYASIETDLYKWTGTHYERLKTRSEQRRIADWCRTTAVEYKVGQWRFSWANQTIINNIWNWVLVRFGVDIEDINPPGLNCLNGVVKIVWEGKKAGYELIPHDPLVVYTYVSEIEFNPECDSSDCDRLLSCLEPHQQQIFIQTLAASLDLTTIRKYRGRMVRALMCQGHGNNGKDSLREAVSLLYGSSLANVTLTDCQQYDSGRKFPLAKLEGALISWSSENSDLVQLDNLQGLKCAIVGDPIDIERKNQGEYPYNPAAVFLFNCNEVPNLKGGLEAIQSRWAVLRFNKTFKVNADPAKGEIEADSRFRYDPSFMKEKVVPALLNKMLAQLETLAMEGIDYSCTDEDWQAVQQETNHLWVFAREIGLDYQVNGKIYINDLWEDLKDWYIANGTLIVHEDSKGKVKYEWHDQARKSDRNVKGANQICQRFTELFPKIIRRVDHVDRDRRGQAYLQGITKTALPASQASNDKGFSSIEPVNFGEAVARQLPPVYKGCEAREAVDPIPAKLFDEEEFITNYFLTLDGDRQQEFLERLIELLEERG